MKTRIQVRVEGTPVRAGYSLKVSINKARTIQRVVPQTSLTSAVLADTMPQHSFSLPQKRYSSTEPSVVAKKPCILGCVPL